MVKLKKKGRKQKKLTMQTTMMLDKQENVQRRKIKSMPSKNDFWKRLKCHSLKLYRHLQTGGMRIIFAPQIKRCVLGGTLWLLFTKR